MTLQAGRSAAFIVFAAFVSLDWQFLARHA